MKIDKTKILMTNGSLMNGTEQKFYLDLSITSSSSQQNIIYKTYILRMHLLFVKIDPRHMNIQ